MSRDDTTPKEKQLARLEKDVEDLRRRLYELENNRSWAHEKWRDKDVWQKKGNTGIV